MTKTHRLMMSGVLTAAALLAPVTLRFDDGMRVVRLNQACGQATECERSTIIYICSTYHADHQGYKCTKGCGSTTQQ
jgi:hypothetical protein